MNIQQIVTGPVQENCYLLWQNNELLVVDPGADAKKISAAIKKTAATPLAIILTIILVRLTRFAMSIRFPSMSALRNKNGSNPHQKTYLVVIQN